MNDIPSIEGVWAKQGVCADYNYPSPPATTPSATPAASCALATPSVAPPLGHNALDTKKTNIEKSSGKKMDEVPVIFMI